MTTQTTTHSERTDARIAETVAPIMSRDGKEYTVDDEALNVLGPLEHTQDIARELAAKLDAVEEFVEEITTGCMGPSTEESYVMTNGWKLKSGIRAILEDSQ